MIRFSVPAILAGVFLFCVGCETKPEFSDINGRWNFVFTPPNSQPREGSMELIEKKPGYIVGKFVEPRGEFNVGGRIIDGQIVLAGDKGGNKVFDIDGFVKDGRIEGVFTDSWKWSCPFRAQLTAKLKSSPEPNRKTMNVKQ